MRHEITPLRPPDIDETLYWEFEAYVKDGWVHHASRHYPIFPFSALSVAFENLGDYFKLRLTPWRNLKNTNLLLVADENGIRFNGSYKTSNLRFFKVMFKNLDWYYTESSAACTVESAYNCEPSVEIIPSKDLDDVLLDEVFEEVMEDLGWNCPQDEIDQEALGIYKEEDEADETDCELV